MALNECAPDQYVPATPTMSCFADNSAFPWMEVALQEFNTRERAGARRHNPRIVEYQASCPGHVGDDETPWCSSFANWVLAQVGIEGSRRRNARSWLNWGRTISRCPPPYGAITVLWRGSPGGWQGHVAFYAGAESGNVILLGGNQGDAVSLRPYPFDRVLGYRWPDEYPVPL